MHNFVMNVSNLACVPLQSSNHLGLRKLMKLAASLAQGTEDSTRVHQNIRYAWVITTSCYF